MHDDNIPYVYWHKEHQGYIQRDETGATSLENIPLFKMFKQWESMFSCTTQTPHVAPSDNAALLKMFTGIF